MALVGLAVFSQTAGALRLRSSGLGRQSISVSPARETNATTLSAFGFRVVSLRQFHFHGEYGRCALSRYM